MWSWYRNQIREFGLMPATRLLFVVAWRRAVVIAGNRALAARVTCPCCGWRGRRFLDYIEIGYRIPNAECPSCQSHSRHRALFLWLRDEYHVDQKAGVALVFAPEKALASLWGSAHKLRTFKIDIEPSRGVDVMADLLRLPFDSEVADLVWCHHVLEQVEDDRVALRELYRVLRSKSGELIVSVGAVAGESTIDFGFSDKSLSGNRRAFGNDFSQRLIEAGFHVEQMEYHLSEEECRTYGVYRESFYRCTRD